jgi:CAAX protease family protein
VENNTIQPPRLLRSALLFYGAMFAIAMGWALASGRSPWYADAAAAARGFDGPSDVGLGLAAAAGVVALSHAASVGTRFGRELARAFAAVLGRLGWGPCALLAATSAVAEESLFRGALQPRVGLVAASLIFGLAHFLPRREFLPWTLFSVGAGFLLGGLFGATGNLVAPVVAHAGINAVNLRLIGTRWGAPPASGGRGH